MAKISSWHFRHLLYVVWLKKASKGGVTGTPGRPLATPMNGWTITEMDDLHLANFKELQLKSKYDFDTMLHLVHAGLGDCMREFVAIQPGDCPCQFHCRQIIYGCPKKFTIHNPELGNIPTDLDIVVSHNHSVIPFYLLQLRQSTAFHITWHLNHYFCLLF